MMYIVEWVYIDSLFFVFNGYLVESLLILGCRYVCRYIPIEGRVLEYWNRIIPLFHKLVT